MDNVAISHVAGVASFAEIPCEVSLVDLKTDVNQLLSGQWVDHVNQQDYNGGWDVLPLRCQSQHHNAHPVLQGFALEADDEWKNLPILQSCSAILSVINNLHCPVKSVRLMRLKTGAEIKPHRDPELSIEYGEARLHLPVFTSADILFSVNNQQVPMTAGKLWYINADQIHAVHNRSNTDRINIVIDCIANEWLREQVYRAEK